MNPPKINMKNNKGHQSQTAKNQWKENTLKTAKGEKITYKETNTIIIADCSSEIM